eukprot:TRINITY_DN29269_c0_g1_i3.p1 TRINITY_DN29269_c0_g1~~TRINITY_DN29269_c0_g1_i3.p1  ORF type:complete len:586 (+),score=114.86 TRINITY_DN29269_c0_g1_i3:175-1932(+)
MSGVAFVAALHFCGVLAATSGSTETPRSSRSSGISYQRGSSARLAVEADGPILHLPLAGHSSRQRQLHGGGGAKVLRREARLSGGSSAAVQTRHPGLLLQDELLSRKAVSHSGVNANGLRALLDFEEAEEGDEEGLCHDSSGNSGNVVESDDSRLQPVQRFNASSSGCKRGRRCLRLLPGKKEAAGGSYAMRMACLPLHEDWSVTAWISTSYERQQTLFFYGKQYQGDDYQFLCQLLPQSRLLCKGPELQVFQKEEFQKAQEATRGFHHVAVTRTTDDQKVRMYWDGKLQSVLTLAPPESEEKGKRAPAGDSETYLYIGSLGQAVELNQDLEGIIDEVTVWSRGLSAGEIVAIRDQPTALASARFQAGIGQLLLLLDFEDAGLTADAPQDMSGNGYVVKRSTGARFEAESCHRGRTCMSFRGESLSKPLEIPCLKLRRDFTFVAWIRPMQEFGQMGLFFQGTRYTEDYGFLCTLKPETGIVSCNGPQFFGTLEAKVSVRSGEWHHMAVTRSARDGVVSVFWDGDLADSGTLSNGPLQKGGSLVLGDVHGAAGRAFAGTMDDVSIWSQALGASEIRRVRGSSFKEE